MSQHDPAEPRIALHGALPASPQTLRHALDTRQAEAIVGAVEAAPQVHLRSQFFVWTQGQMQALLPHRVLVCGAYDRTQLRLLFNVFNSIRLPAAAMRALGDDGSPLMAALVARWLAGGHRPAVIDLAALTGDAGTVATLLASDANVHSLLVHGISRPRRPQEIESLFLFADTGPAGNQAPESAAEMMLPFLHVAWRRVMSSEASAAPHEALASGQASVDTARRGLQVTKRECQILEGMRDGKSNREIAEHFKLSPLTVKNHVQKILRKLSASNRTQAVTQALAQNLLAPAKQSSARHR